MRVRVAHRDYARSEGRPEEWLLIEWPEGEKEPAKYGFRALPKDVILRKLVDLAKPRWRIERDSGRDEVENEHEKDEAGTASITMPAVHHGLRIPRLREEEDYPLTTL